MLAKKIHVLDFMFVPLLWLITILLTERISAYILILAISTANLLLMTNKIQFKKLGWFCLSLIPVVLAMFLSTYWFAKSTAGMDIVQFKLLLAGSLSLRLLVLSLVSFAFMLHARSDKIILYLIQRKILNVKVGYALLSAFNTFNYLGGSFSVYSWLIACATGATSYRPKFFCPYWLLQPGMHTV